MIKEKVNREEIVPTIVKIDSRLIMNEKVLAKLNKGLHSTEV
jgi:hypothetical protein